MTLIKNNKKTILLLGILGVATFTLSNKYFSKTVSSEIRNNSMIVTNIEKKKRKTLVTLNSKFNFTESMKFETNDEDIRVGDVLFVDYKVNTSRAGSSSVEFVAFSKFE